MDEDNRIIDLDLDDSKLPDFFYTLTQPINMTLCAGDGNQQGMTDIEWFVTKKEGYNREKKSTTIFITAKNYEPRILEENKKYLRSHPELKVILLVYDDKNPRWKENLVRLFPDLINNIYEDESCYGDKLDLSTLYIILREGGIYHMESYNPKVNLFMKELHSYKDYFRYFTIDLENPPYKIIKNNGDMLKLPVVWTFSDDANGLERFKLDKLDYDYRTKYTTKGGGKKTKTKKSRKIKSNKTKKTKKSRKIKSNKTRKTKKTKNIKSIQ